MIKGIFKTIVNYVTLNICTILRYPIAVLIFSKLIPQQLSMKFKKFNACIYKTSSYKCSCIC